jgi:hypothetical protein
MRKRPTSEQSHGLLAKLLRMIFLGPGKLIANYLYLFPARGTLWASRRRKDNSFVHFWYTTILYAVIGFVLLVLAAVNAGPPGQDNSNQRYTRAELHPVVHWWQLPPGHYVPGPSH